MIGGRNNSLSGNVDCDSVDRYDPLLDEWKSVCSLTVPRNRVGIGVIDGYVYAIGGSHGNLYLNLVEKYDADEDFWEEVAPLTVPRIGKSWCLEKNCIRFYLKNLSRHEMINGGDSLNNFLTT